MLHLSPAEWGLMHQAEFWEAMCAYREEKDADRRHIGELIRGATVRLVNTQLKSPITEVESFWPMPWDEPLPEDEELARLNALSDDERAKEIARFKEIAGL